MTNIPDTIGNRKNLKRLQLSLFDRHLTVLIKTVMMGMMKTTTVAQKTHHIKHWQRPWKWHRKEPSKLYNGKIHENTAEYGAGIYLAKNVNFGGKGVPTFTISGGTITKNSADFVGGGVYVGTGCALTQNGGTLSANTAGDGEGENIFKQE
jgi:hypothetical protein